MSDGFFTGQGIIATILGAAIYPAWHVIVWAVAGLFGLEAILMLGFGLIMLAAGLSD